MQNDGRNGTVVSRAKPKAPLETGSFAVGDEANDKQECTRVK